MNSIPILDRELRVAARKRSTFWLRVAAAGTALIIGTACLLLELVQGSGTSQFGSALFSILIWLAFGAALLSGLFFTADCLSEEKRQGTLGLLFLAELRGSDVVTGKMVASSLRMFYALLSILPILGITQLMGGVTGAQFWKCVLGLGNALFFSLAAGMCVSALSRDSQKALAGSALVLLLATLGGPAADSIVAAIRRSPFQTWWTLSSPGYVLTEANAWGMSVFWKALVVNQLLAWLMFAMACVLASRTWQEKRRAGSGNARGWIFAWKYGGLRRRARLRRSLLDRQPVAWLAARERWQATGLWTIALLATGGLATALIAEVPRETWMVWMYLGGLLTFLLYLWAASQACRFHVEAQRSGLLELLLVSPLSATQVVRGQWLAVRRMFGLPILLLLLVHLTGTSLSQISLHRLMSAAGAMTTTVATNQSGTVTSQTVVITTTGAATSRVRTTPAAAPITTPAQPGSARKEAAMVIVSTVASGLGTIGNLLAIYWFGMWMGITSRNASMATLKTFAFVQIVPALVISFGTGMVMAIVMAGYFARAGKAPASWIMWWPLVSATVSAAAALAKDMGFILWSRNKLHTSFRDQATRSVRPMERTPTPILSSSPSLPPVIPAGT
jgi:ABC-type transport system involved in multi-copper enzyme maturation permease subunit